MEHKIERASSYSIGDEDEDAELQNAIELTLEQPDAEEDGALVSRCTTYYLTYIDIFISDSGLYPT